MTQEKDQIEVRTFNWGPCLINLKIRDDFKKILLDEAAKNEQDFSSKLAGQIRKETGYSDESRDKIVPYLAPYLGVYDQMFQKYQAKNYEKKPEYTLTALWANFQRQYEFNPPHDHGGTLSWVIFLQMPKELIEENKKYQGRSAGPGGLTFIYGEGPRSYISHHSFFPEEGDMFIFPASLKHWVFPFKSDCVRISVSGNVNDSIKYKDLKKIKEIKKNEQDDNKKSD